MRGRVFVVYLLSRGLRAHFYRSVDGPQLPWGHFAVAARAQR
jgi:hypothetical protein